MYICVGILYVPGSSSLTPKKKKKKGELTADYPKHRRKKKIKNKKPTPYPNMSAYFED